MAGNQTEDKVAKLLTTFERINRGKESLQKKEKATKAALNAELDARDEETKELRRKMGATERMNLVQKAYHYFF